MPGLCSRAELEQRMNYHADMSYKYVYMTRHGACIDSGSERDADWCAKAGEHIVKTQSAMRPRLLPAAPVLQFTEDDPHLSPSGRRAASELATRMQPANLPQPVAHIVSSPFVVHAHAHWCTH